MRWWKVVGLAGLAGVAATGVAVARAEQRRRAYTPDEIRDRLHLRIAEAAGAEAPPDGPPPGPAGPGPRTAGLEPRSEQPATFRAKAAERFRAVTDRVRALRDNTVGASGPNPDDIRALRDGTIGTSRPRPGRHRDH